MNGSRPRLRIGAKLGEDLTILGRVDDRSDDPVLIVWNHRAWCPMACKLFRSPQRARREAEALAALAHPNIVRCLGLFEPTHILMEFLEGPTLSRLIRKQRGGRLSVSNAVRVAIHLGAALGHMHARGFLHMDVKPGNVIVVHGRPVLFDFGWMRQRQDPRPSQVAGTDPYIAPEEALLEAASPAADVFGLGITLYEMLTGALPFPQATRARPFPQIDRAPVRLRQHRPAAAPALEELVLGCLARDPAARPSLPVLLPALHQLIRDGVAMWPPGFRPELARRAGAGGTAPPQSDLTAT